MISGPVAAATARLSRLVVGLDDRPWSEDLAALGDGPDAVVAAAEAPRYGDIARAGTALVAGLAGEGRWAEAATQARHLRRFFAATGLELGPIAAQAFDGLLAATMARDADELKDFTELVTEMFP